MRSEFDPRDQRILEITKQLCQDIGISDYNPTFVSWEVNKVRTRPSDGPVEFDVDDCLIEHYFVGFASSMRYVLDPEEWKPIIASSLIFSKKLRKRIVRFLLLAIVAFGILDIFVYAILSMLFPQPIMYAGRSGYCCYTTTLGGVLALPVGLTIGLLGTMILSLLFARRTRLLADRMAANIVGRGVFLDTLNEISQAMSQRVSRRGPLPDIGTRIKKLERVESPQTM